MTLFHGRWRERREPAGGGRARARRRRRPSARISTPAPRAAPTSRARRRRSPCSRAIPCGRRRCRCRSRTWCGASNARLDAPRPAPRVPLGVRRDRRPRPRRSWRRGGAAPRSSGRRRRRRPRSPRVGSDADAPDEIVARMERRLSRDQAARYLDEAQDVLVTVAGHPADCEREHGRVDVGEEAQRSRELLARRALMVELGGDEVASARPLLDDVEGMLREVAALPACARAGLAGRDPSPDAAPERAHEDRPAHERAARMRRLLLVAALALCGGRGVRADGRGAPAGGQGADLRPQVRGGAHGLDRHPRPGARARGGRGGLLDRALLREPRRARAGLQGVRDVPGPPPGGSQQGRGGAHQPHRPRGQAVPRRPGLVPDRAPGGAHGSVQDRALLRGAPAGRPRCSRQPGRAARAAGRCSRTRPTRTCSTACASSC